MFIADATPKHRYVGAGFQSQKQPHPQRFMVSVSVQCMKVARGVVTVAAVLIAGLLVLSLAGQISVGDGESESGLSQTVSELTGTEPSSVASDNGQTTVVKTNEEVNTEPVQLVVGVNQSAKTKNITPAVRQSIAFWEAKSSEYDETYAAEFELRPDADEPDIIVNDYMSAECSTGVSEKPGCADLIESASMARDVNKPITVFLGLTEITNQRHLSYTLKHEFAHLLSASHCAQPVWLLGCPNTAQYEDRSHRTADSPWRTGPIKIHVNETAQTVTGEILSQYRQSGKLRTPVMTVDTKWEADIVVSGAVCSSCQDVSQTVSYSGGQPYDTDDNTEFLLNATVQAHGPSEKLLRFELGQAIGRVLTPTDRPQKYAPRGDE